jgi:outer membrane protein OmpA-like peptidoglycan-associated protein
VPRRAFFAILFFLLSSATPSLAQQADSVYYVDSLVPSLMRIEHKPFRAGVSLNFGWNRFDSINGQTLPDDMGEGCDRYEKGMGGSLQGGLHLEYPLWGDASPFSLLLGLGYRSIAGTLSYDVKYPTYDFIDSSIRDKDFRADIHHRSSGIAISPGLVIEPLKHLRFTLQPELDFFFYKKYHKNLIIVSPGVTFNDDSRERELKAITSTDSARTFNAAIRSTIGYEVPLSSKLYAEPQIGITIPLLGVTPYWYAWRFEAGISLHYDLTPRFETIEVFNNVKVPRYVERQKPVETAKPKLKASITAIGVSREGIESPVLKMSVEEVRSRNAYPVLTYVFFDENSAEIPARYRQYTGPVEAQREFKGAEIRENIKPLELYEEVLNVLGSRLKADRNARIKLIGSIANTSSEAGKIQLARSRAETIREYLVKVWSIPPNRITIEAKLDPDKPSPNTTEEGREENRRVEFVISDEKITDPVTVLNIERLATPDLVKFKPSIEADTNVVKIKSLTASVLANGRVLVTHSTNSSANTKVWAVTEQDILQFKDSLQLKLEVEDQTGNIYVAWGSLPIAVAQNTTDKPERIERFSLILFDFDQSRIEDKNDRMIQRVATALPTLQAERITIVGHTDESGDEAYNDRLSKTRAEEAKLALERAAAAAGIKLPTRILTDGLGSRERLFDNSLPEGRFYSRTVNITVEKRH